MLKFEEIRTVAVLIIVGIVIMVSGCQTGKGFCDDTASVANYLSEKITPMVDKQKANDAERNAKWLMRYQAEQNAQNQLASREN